MMVQTKRVDGTSTVSSLGSRILLRDETQLVSAKKTEPAYLASPPTAQLAHIG
jgi:hypothetical protein